METTYKIMGSDGNEYGPVSLAQLQSWISEGRVTGATHVLRSDQNAWTTAASYAELHLQDALPSPQPAQAVSDTPALHLEKQMKSGAHWFFWIAGLSVINSIVAHTGSEWGFMLGLGITQVIDAVARGLGSAGTMVAIGLDALAAGVLVLFGVFARQRHTWSFIVGMILYALDGLIFVIGQDWVGVGFHVFALFCIFRGFQAARGLKANAA